jgi:hypothetical protein
VKRRGDSGTLDLFATLETAPAVARFDAERVRGATINARIAKAVAAVLKDAGRSRDVIAQEMSAYLGEPVSRASLEAFASEAKEGHTISAPRLVALFVVTGDLRLLNAVLADTGAIAVEERYEALIRRERYAELEERASRERQAADAAWRARR